MRLLLVNDDGIDAPGLQALSKVLRTRATVTVAAPDRERSAAGQAFTFGRPYRVERLSERTYQVFGTPVDCVMFAVTTLGPFDMVVSGINKGANVGWDVWYSGTVGAALEAARRQIPALAVSLDTMAWPGPPLFAEAAEAVGRYVDRGLLDACPGGLAVNLNFPNQVDGLSAPLGLARPGSFVYNENQIETERESPTAVSVRVVQRRTTVGHAVGTDGNVVRARPSVTLLDPTLKPAAMEEPLLKRWEVVRDGLSASTAAPPRRESRGEEDD